MMRYMLATAAAALFGLTACGHGSTSTATHSSSISIAGSTALLPLVKQAANDYQALHPGVSISVAGGGSRVGIAQAAQHGVDIGDSDIPAPNEPKLVDHKIAVVTFDVVVNPKSGVRSLSTAQLRSIFSGAVTNFSQVGGANVPITVINRPRSSGTRAVFIETVLGGRQPNDAGFTQDSSGAVAAIVAQTPGAISYVATAYMKPGKLQAIAINGFAPSPENIKGGKYPYWSYEHMLTNGPPKPAVAGFIDYVKIDTALLRQLGFMPADVKPLASSH